MNQHINLACLNKANLQAQCHSHVQLLTKTFQQGPWYASLLHPCQQMLLIFCAKREYVKVWGEQKQICLILWHATNHIGDEIMQQMQEEIGLQSKIKLTMYLKGYSTTDEESLWNNVYCLTEKHRVYTKIIRCRKHKIFSQSLGQFLGTHKSRLGGARVNMFHESS